MKEGHGNGGPSPDVPGAAGPGSAAVRSSALGLGVLLAIVAIAVVILRGNGALLGAATPSLPPTLAASPMPSATPSPTEPAPPPTSSAPTSFPQATLPGELPGPDATVPAGASVIPGLTIRALASLWSSVGLSCESHLGGFPGAQGGYHIECEHTDTGADMAYVGESVYWALDGVQTVSLKLNSATMGGTVDGAGTASQVLFPTVELIGGQEARAWVEARLGDPACLDECAEQIGGTNYVLYTGVRGGYSLHIEQELP